MGAARKWREPCAFRDLSSATPVLSLPRSSTTGALAKGEKVHDRNVFHGSPRATAYLTLHSALFSIYSLFIECRLLF